MQITASTILAIKGGASGAEDNTLKEGKAVRAPIYSTIGTTEDCATAPPKTVNIVNTVSSDEIPVAPLHGAAIVALERLRSALELVLLGWACDHWSEPVDALLARWGDWEFEKKCLGAIFRKAAAADRAWFFSVCVSHPREVVALGRYIRSIPMASLGGAAEWGEVPGAMGWVEYVKALRLVEGS